MAQREQQAISARVYRTQVDRLREVFGARGVSAGLRFILDQWIETAGEVRIEVAAQLAGERARDEEVLMPALERDLQGFIDRQVAEGNLPPLGGPARAACINVDQMRAGSR